MAAQHMQPIEFSVTGRDDAGITILLAHGAGGPMNPKLMAAAANAPATAGFRPVRFEFARIADRRKSGSRRPPPRADKVSGEYIAAVTRPDCKGPPIVGGKWTGGGVASMVAEDLRKAGKIAALLCLGCPLHPPSKPENLRTAHLAALETPA
jgi:predicted alpha/beta-hydrolase family hydrolase